MPDVPGTIGHTVADSTPSWRPHHAHRRVHPGCAGSHSGPVTLRTSKVTGIVPDNTDLPGRNDGVRAWDDQTTDEHRLFVRLQAAYAGMLDHADTQLARLVAHLEASGQLDDALVLVLSDNGASQEGGPLGYIYTLRPVSGIPERWPTRSRDSSTRRAKQVEYFEMFGHRGLWQDG